MVSGILVQVIYEYDAKICQLSDSERIVCRLYVSLVLFNFVSHERQEKTGTEHLQVGRGPKEHTHEESGKAWVQQPVQSYQVHQQQVYKGEQPTVEFYEICFLTINLTLRL
jgi:hypothetical protein